MPTGVLDTMAGYVALLEAAGVRATIEPRDINRAESSTGSILNLYEFQVLRARLTARAFMSTALITISPDAMIEEAAGLMIEHKISGLPVVENGKMVGLITETDICIFVMQLETVA